MRKFILCSILALMVCSCGYEIRKKPEPPKPKLTKEQIRKQEYEQRLKDYEVVFLFECNGVKVYRYVDRPTCIGTLVALYQSATKKPTTYRIAGLISFLTRGGR